MADFTGSTRTNYFRVKDEDAFRGIMVRALSDDEIEVWEEQDDKGNKTFAFGLFGSITGILPKGATDGDEGLNRDIFFKELQAVVAEDDAVLFIEAGTEDLRFVNGWVTVITSDDMRFANLATSGKILAREMLGNLCWTTQNEY